MLLQSVDPDLLVGGEERYGLSAGNTAKLLFWGTATLTHGQLVTWLSGFCVCWMEERKEDGINRNSKLTELSINSTQLTMMDLNTMAGWHQAVQNTTVQCSVEFHYQTRVEMFT